MSFVVAQFIAPAAGVGQGKPECPDVVLFADAFGFELLGPEGYEAGAKYLLRRGYR